MNNYLLSIDPSIKNTGFTLWEKTKIISECEIDYKEIEYIYKWKPILVKSYNFKKYSIKTLLELKWEIKSIIIPNIDTKQDNTYLWLEKFDLIIERGIFNPKFGKGKETLEHLRGFITGIFNKIITKDMLISPKSWQNWYINFHGSNNPDACGRCFYEIHKEWTKESSLIIAKCLFKFNNWNIKINNHDEADSLLIGWYYLNKGEKYE